MKFKEILNEAKQVGTIYHYTSLSKCIKILLDNKLLHSHEGNFISFTRNQNFHFYPRESIDTEIRIAFDGNKLSEKYKITPYNDWNFSTKTKEERIIFDEDEERLNNIKEINNIKNYIINITIVKKYPLPIYDKLIDNLNKICIKNKIKLIDNIGVLKNEIF